MIVDKVNDLYDECDVLTKNLGKLLLLKRIFSNYAGGKAKAWEESLDDGLATLPKREEELLRMRFGLDGGKMMFLREIADVFGVTRERIRQIEGKALRRLRRPSRKLLLLGMSWQMATQEAKDQGYKLLLKAFKGGVKSNLSIWDLSVDEFDLPLRVYHAIRRAGYKTVGDVFNAGKKKVAKENLIGHKTMRMLNNWFKKHNLDWKEMPTITKVFEGNINELKEK